MARPRLTSGLGREGAARACIGLHAFADIEGRLRRERLAKAGKWLGHGGSRASTRRPSCLFGHGGGVVRESRSQEHPGHAESGEKHRDEEDCGNRIGIWSGGGGRRRSRKTRFHLTQVSSIQCYVPASDRSGLIRVPTLRSWCRRRSVLMLVRQLSVTYTRESPACEAKGDKSKGASHRGTAACPE